MDMCELKYADGTNSHLTKESTNSKKMKTYNNVNVRVCAQIETAAPWGTFIFGATHFYPLHSDQK